MLTKFGGKQIWVDLDWDNITTDSIAAGTPIGADGLVHNDSQAIGILLKQCDRTYLCDGEILIAGFIDETERYAVSGVKLSSECRAALNIAFKVGGASIGNIAVAG